MYFNVTFGVTLSVTTNVTDLEDVTSYSPALVMDPAGSSETSVQITRSQHTTASDDLYLQHTDVRAKRIAISGWEPYTAVH